jgi:diguanylate cyclase (GGDEF)-like protein/PAS domain S-box-containing protein
VTEKPTRKPRRKIEKELVNQREFRRMLDLMDEGVWVVDLQGMTILVNQRLAELLGYSPSDMIGCAYTQFLDGESNSLPVSMMKSNQWHEARNIELALLHKNGSKIWVRAASMPILDENSQPAGGMVMITDITGQKQIENALSETEDRYRIVSQLFTDYAFCLNVREDGRLTWAWGSGSKPWTTNLEQSQDLLQELVGYIHPIHLILVRAHIRRVLAGNEDTIEFTPMVEGGDYWIHLTSRPVYDEKRKRVTHIYGAAKDITTQKRFEEALLKSEQHYRTLFEENPISLWEEDFSEVKRQINKLRENGISDFRAYFTDHPEEAARFAALVKVVNINKVTLDLFHAERKEDLFRLDRPDKRDEKFPRLVLLREELIAMCEGKTRYTGKSVQFTLDGEKLDVLANLTIAPGYEDSWAKVFFSIIDIREQEKAFQALREIQARNAAILKALPDSMFIFDRTGVFLDFYISETNQFIFSENISVGKSFWEMLPAATSPLFVNFFKTVLETGQMQMVEFPYQQEDRIHYFEVRGVPYEENKILTILRDVTEQRLAEETLHRRDVILEAVNFSAEKLLHASDWGNDMHEVLGRLGQAANANRVFIFQNHKNPENDVLASIRFEWCAENIPAQLELADQHNISLTQGGLERWMERLCKNQTLQGPVREMPVDIRHKMEMHGVKSILVVPIQIEDELWGFMGFEDYQKEHVWAELDVDVIRTAADFLGTAIQRKRAEDALRKSEERYRTLVEVPPEAIINTDMAGQILFVNQKFAMMLRIASIEELIGREVVEFIETDDRARTYENIRKIFIDGELKEVEYTFQRSDGASFPGGVSIGLIVDHEGKPGGLIWVVRDITERKHAQEALIKANFELKRSIDELGQYNREATLRNEMGNLLQSCLTVEEAYAVIAQYGEELFDRMPGQVYKLNESRNLMETVVGWGEPIPGVQLISPSTCWALRRGRAHVVNETNQRLRCDHLECPESGGDPINYICVPMTAQGNTIGVLFQQVKLAKPVAHLEQLIRVFAERASLALANLTLSESLRFQSVRDPLTNLFNRRYMEETLEREFRQAVRHKRSLGVLMLDLDHFKLFNDTNGHAAGDALLREMGTYLAHNIRSSDVVCRYGGDEFAIIMPESNLEESKKRAEQLRLGIKNLQVEFRSQLLNSVTVSIGVTSFPEQGKSTEEILRIADDALYRVKKTGRDRVFFVQQ